MEIIENILALKMRYGFGINTDPFETNILNLAVVVGIVRKFVGGELTSILDQRRAAILLTLAETDKKVREAEKQLEEAKNSVDMAHLRAQELRTQARQRVEQENARMQQQLVEGLQYLRASRDKTIQLERQLIVRSIAKQVSDLALTSTERTLLTAFGQSPSKQKELNEKHIQVTLRQLKSSVGLDFFISDYGQQAN